MKKPYILIGIVAILAIVYIANNRRAVAPENPEPYRTTLSGTVDCLQPKDPSLPTTGECRLALKTDTGEYFALDFNLLSQERPTLPYGSKLTATGLVTPVEYLSSDLWQKYNMKGIFSVTDSVKQEITK